jgi:predicted transcriptional regulator of viral defense system
LLRGGIVDYRKKIIDQINLNKGYITTKELGKLNINRFYLSSLEKEGVIERIKRGLYKDINHVNENEIEEVARIVPNGVICLVSALGYYGLTTTIPVEYSIAVPKKTKIVLPDYPPIKLHYFVDKYYTLGIKSELQGGVNIKIYSIEKTICDLIRFKSKIGSDIIIEAIKNYMKQNDRDIQLLMKFARETKTFEIIKKYIEVLV